MYATALGDETEAKKYSTAVGAAAKANTSEGATALGYGAEASGSNAISIGRGAVANGAYDPIAIGAIASGGYSVAIGSTANALGNYSVSIGSDACAHNTSAVAVGDEASAHGNYSSAYGYSAGARADNSTALGYNATAEGLNSVAIGDALAEGGSSIAIGVSSHVGENSSSSIALGAGATVASNAENSVAIGAGATAPCSNVIVLGTANHVVYIPGKLMVDGDSVLGVKSDSKTYLQLDDDGDDYPTLIEGRPVQLVGRNLLMYKGSFLRSLQEFANPPKTETETETKSDRRLKNVGEVFKGGLAELKKIELFHFTFKADEKKIPHVGVMAQDLKKIFPNAVWEGKDGFLRIRWDEMFFALINAVKELDAKIDLLAQKQKKIDELEKRIDKLEKRLNVIEKKL